MWLACGGSANDLPIENYILDLERTLYQLLPTTSFDIGDDDDDSESESDSVPRGVPIIGHQNRHNNTNGYYHKPAVPHDQRALLATFEERHRNALASIRAASSNNLATAAGAPFSHPAASPSLSDATTATRSQTPMEDISDPVRRGSLERALPVNHQTHAASVFRRIPSAQERAPSRSPSRPPRNNNPADVSGGTAPGIYPTSSILRVLQNSELSS